MIDWLPPPKVGAAQIASHFNAYPIQQPPPRLAGRWVCEVAA
jgi:hypothetical protein